VDLRKTEWRHTRICFGSGRTLAVSSSLGWHWTLLFHCAYYGISTVLHAVSSKCPSTVSCSLLASWVCIIMEWAFSCNQIVETKVGHRERHGTTAVSSAWQLQPCLRVPLFPKALYRKPQIKTRIKLSGLNPRANYTDRATTASQRS
jgi:hypothetical protein